MTADFTYMGTKRRLASHVASVVERASPGPILDLFAGMSAVGRAVGDARNVWCNDVQVFAHTVAGAFFTSESKFAWDEDDRSVWGADFERNMNQLVDGLGSWAVRESDAYQSRETETIQAFISEIIVAAVRNELSAEYALTERVGLCEPYCLFSTIYPGGYVGLKQCMEIDSIRYVIDKHVQRNPERSPDKKWMLAALGHVLARVSTSPGHFAQYLVPKSGSLSRYLAYRRRSVWAEWLDVLPKLEPLGSSEWRRQNRTYNLSASSLLAELGEANEAPAVIYADPPYTSDHYSRYYHLWETLILYDYPEVAGKARYRADRFSSPFSIKTKAAIAFDELFRMVSQLGSTFVLSYPRVGLLENAHDHIFGALSKHFPNVELALNLSHSHSSFGASKGASQSAVEEMVFYASH